MPTYELMKQEYFKCMGLPEILDEITVTDADSTCPKRWASKQMILSIRVCLCCLKLLVCRRGSKHFEVRDQQGSAPAVAFL